MGCGNPQNANPGEPVKVDTKFQENKKQQVIPTNSSQIKKQKSPLKTSQKGSSSVIKQSQPNQMTTSNKKMSQKKITTSTKSLPKDEKSNKTMKTTSESIGSSLPKNNANTKSGTNVQISPSKVKLDVHTQVKQNQEIDGQDNEKRAKKIHKKKKADPKLGELIKIYGL